MTLTDFLLARIAEDEEWLREYGEMRNGWVPGPRPVDDCRRLLAECEAKRQILRDFELFAPPHGWFRHAMRTLGHLALPYADHPEYREEWRV
jgi:hypothetical protein